MDAAVILIDSDAELAHGTPSRVSEILRGKKGLSMAMVQRLRPRFRVPADLLLPIAQEYESPPRDEARSGLTEGNSIGGSVANAEPVSLNS